jgi:predicted nucleic acid-binding protein
MRSSDAIAAVERIISAVGVISPTLETHFLAVELIKKHKLTADKIFDAYLAATAISNSLSTIATDNERDFKKLEVIKVYNPFLPSF